MLLISLLPGFASSQDERAKIDSLFGLLHKAEPENKSPVFSEIALEIQDRDTALIFADSAILFAKVFKNLKDEADGNRTKGRIYFDSDDDSLALACFSDAVNLYNKTRNKSEIIQTYALMARSYNYLGFKDTAYFYLDRARDMAESINDRKGLSDVYHWRAGIARRSREYDQAILYYGQSIVIKKEIGDKEGLADNYANLGLLYYLMGQYTMGNIQYELALDLYEEMEDHYEAGRMLLRIGNANIERGNYVQSTDFLQRALINFELLGSDAGMGACYNSLAVAFFMQEKYDDAIKYHEDHFELSRQNSDKQGMYLSLNNLGNIYANIARDSLIELYGVDFLDYVVSNPSEKYLDIYSEAWSHYKRALELEYELNNTVGIAGVLHNLGSIYLHSGKLGEAQEHFRKSIVYYEKLNDHKGLANIYILLGEIKTYRKDYQKANEYFITAQSIAEEMKLYEPLAKVYQSLFRLYRSQGRYRTAFDYQIKYQEIKDTLHAQLMERLNEELEYNLEAEKESNAQKIDRVYQLWEQQKELERARDRNRNIMLIASLSILMLLLLFAIYVYRALKLKHRANILLEKQKKEIESQRDEISIQKNKLEKHKDMLEEQKQAITDSIQYASRIQSAILPSKETMQHFLPKHFILFKPRDIVSGDFYWLGSRGNKTLLAAVDCTGHGVPGAIMSMLGSSLLSEILTTIGEVSSNGILDELRDRIIIALHQTGEKGEAKDGMDMALCIFDQTRKHVQFSGAQNPFYLIRDGKLTEIKGDRMPIGISISEAKPFMKHDIMLKKGDALYMFSDGYIDQFGGPKGRKFMAARFRELLLQIQDKIMFEQREILEHALSDWMNPPEKPDMNYAQIDDILVIGIKI